MSTWKPGDVAMVECRIAPVGPFPSARDRKGWCTLDPSIGFIPDDDVAATRPLVVISPEDREQVERLWRLESEQYEVRRDPQPEEVTHLQQALRDFATPKPPKPDEPGTWGVVEAACVHSNARREWMRHRDGNWYVVGTDTKNNPDDWDSLIDPVVVREGVTQ